MAVVVAFEEDVLWLICGYAPQGGRCLEEKQSFYDELKGEWDIHSAGDLFMCMGDFNGHIGRLIDGFDWVHGGYGVGQKNLKRKNDIIVLCQKGIVCQKRGLQEKKRGR